MAESESNAGLLCLVPATELEYGEYVYQICYNCDSRLVSTNEVDLRKIVSALANTSGGVVLITTRSGRSIGDKEFDEWCNNQKDKLKKFLPDNVYHGIQVFLEDDHVCVHVKKAGVFITANTHMYIRGMRETDQVKSIDDVKRILTQSTGEKLELPLYRPCVHGTICNITEIKNIEFAYFVTAQVAQLINRLKGRKLQAIIAMANDAQGGYMLLGVEESTETRFIGQIMKEEDKAVFIQKFAKLLTEPSDGCKTIWGTPDVVPMDGVHFSCEFIPVYSPDPVNTERRVLVLIHVKHCPGGVFKCTPEAFVVDEAGQLKALPFLKWRQIHGIVETDGIEKQSTTPNRSRSTSASLDGEKSTMKRTPSRSKKMPPTLESQTRLTFKQHSKSYTPQEAVKPRQDMLPHPEQSDLFVLAMPVRYTPCRDKITSILRNDKVLTLIDGKMAGLQAFGIAADTLVACLGVSLDIQNLDVPGTSNELEWTLEKLVRPKYHLMDLMVVNSQASVHLFVVVSELGVGRVKKMQKAYAFVLGRILKRRIIESMPGDGDCVIVSVLCTVVSIDGRSWSSPDYYLNWLIRPSSGSNFKYLCHSLRKILTQDCDTHLSGVLDKEASFVQFSRHQMDALTGTESTRFTIIDGPPGCGKTILAQHICEQKIRHSETAAFVCASEPLAQRVKYVKHIPTYCARDCSEFISLLKNDLKSTDHVVLDDGHNFAFDEKSCRDICSHFVESDRNLYIFLDSLYHSYKVMGSTSFDIFLVQNKRLYGSILLKTLHVIRRNSQLVGSFLGLMISDINQRQLSSTDATVPSQVLCESALSGDNICINHVPDLRSKNEENGLLQHVKQIIDHSRSTHLNHKTRQYDLYDIAILVDHPKENIILEEIETFSQIFKEFWPEAKIQNAATNPVEGLTIDSLEAFSGLEARVVVFILPKQAKTERPDPQKSITNPKYKMAIVSRGIERVDFLQEDKVSTELAEEMKLDNYSVSLLDDWKTKHHLWTYNCDSSITGISVSSNGDMAICSQSGLKCISQNRRPTTVLFPETHPTTNTWAVSIHPHIDNAATVHWTPKTKGFVVATRSGWQEDFKDGEFPCVLLFKSCVIVSMRCQSKGILTKCPLAPGKERLTRETHDGVVVLDMAAGPEHQLYCCTSTGGIIHVYNQIDLSLTNTINPDEGLLTWSLCFHKQSHLLMLHDATVNGNIVGKVSMWSVDRGGGRAVKVSDVVVSGLPSKSRQLSSLIRLFGERLIFAAQEEVKAYDISKALKL